MTWGPRELWVTPELGEGSRDNKLLQTKSQIQLPSITAQGCPLAISPHGLFEIYALSLGFQLTS